MVSRGFMNRCINKEISNNSGIQGCQDEIIDNTEIGGICQNCFNPKNHGRICRIPAKNLLITKYDLETMIMDDFSELQLFRKFKAIEQILDAYVRPSLLQAGQDIDVEDFEMKGNIPVVFISFYGVCCGRRAVVGDILNDIQNILKKVLHPDFQVKITSPNMPAAGDFYK